jgi:hypothetical protein
MAGCAVIRVHLTHCYIVPSFPLPRNYGERHQPTRCCPVFKSTLVISDNLIYIHSYFWQHVLDQQYLEITPKSWERCTQSTCYKVITNLETCSHDVLNISYTNSCNSAGHNNPVYTVYFRSVIVCSLVKFFAFIFLCNIVSSYEYIYLPL